MAVLEEERDAREAVPREFGGGVLSLVPVSEEGQDGDGRHEEPV